MGVAKVDTMRKLFIGLIIVSLLLVGCDNMLPSNLGDSENRITTQIKATEVLQTTTKNQPDYTISEVYYKTWTNSVSPYIQLIVSVTNTGTTRIFIGKAHFVVKGTNGKDLVEIDSYTVLPPIIGPGQTTYITVTEQVDKTVDSYWIAGVTTEIDASVTKNEQNILQISSLKIHKNTALGLTASGLVKNDTDHTCSDIRIGVVLFDANKQVICILTGRVVKVAPGDTVGFSTLDMLPNDLLEIQSASSLTIAYYNFQS